MHLSGTKHASWLVQQDGISEKEEQEAADHNDEGMSRDYDADDHDNSDEPVALVS